jgi:hypothetical protein
MTEVNLEEKYVTKTSKNRLILFLWPNRNQLETDENLTINKKRNLEVPDFLKAGYLFAEFSAS